MTACFTDIFTAALKATPTMMNGATLRMYLFPTAPAFATNDSRYLGIETITDLTEEMGWGNYLTPSPTDFTVGTVDVGDSRFVIRSDPIMMHPDWDDSLVVTIAFALVTGTLAGKLAFVTNRPLQELATVVRGQDGITAQPNSDLPADAREFFGWSLSGAVSGPRAAPSEGAIVMFRGPPDFEPAKTQHVWIFPQRVNMVANPSFENDTRFWRHDGTLVRAAGYAPGVGGGSYYGKFTGTVIESNTFPLMIRKEIPEGWTIQLQVRGDGELKVGLVTFPASFEQTIVDWGPVDEAWYLSGTWSKIRSLRRIGDVNSGMLRLETNGTYIDIDHVCVEPGFLPENYNDWPYFDGDTIFGAEGDFTWYNDEPHASYSCWINHRAGVFGRLFAWDVVKGTSPDVITDEEAREQGLAYQWVPAGTPVTYHDDVLFVGDPQTLVLDVVGDVLPSDLPTDLPTTDVVSPWPFVIADGASATVSDEVTIVVV